MLLGAISKTILLVVVPFSLTSCSIFSGNKIDSLPVSPIDGVTLSEVSEDPFLYKLAVTDGDNSRDLFLTRIQECGVKDSTPSVATTRQLLVGFSNIDLRSQDYVPLNGRNILRSNLSAKLDDKPVSLTCYTVRDSGCVQDVLFWSFLDEKSDDKSLQNLDNVAQGLLNAITS